MRNPHIDLGDEHAEGSEIYGRRLTTIVSYKLHFQLLLHNPLNRSGTTFRQSLNIQCLYSFMAPDIMALNFFIRVIDEIGGVNFLLYILITIMDSVLPV